MKAGALRHRLVFEMKTETQDTFGAPQEVWATAFTVWGAYEPVEQPIFTEETLIALKITAQIQARFHIRYRADITVDRHRVVFNGKTWNIHTITPADGRNIELIVDASELK